MMADQCLLTGVQRVVDQAATGAGGMVFHVLNRCVARRRLARKDADYEAFERVIEQTLKSAPLRICAYCLDW